jgi:isopenicillin-N N-acyltransferase like protein
MKKTDFSIDLSGTSAEIGFAHGKAFRPLIRSATDKWKADLADISGMPFDKILGNFLSYSNYRPAIEKWAPHLLEEMRGIAEGAQLGEDLIYAWQMVDEVLDFLAEHITADKCSTVGGYDQVEGAGPVIGKTQDLPHCYIGTGVLVRTRYDEHDIYNSTIAGVISQENMTSNLGVCLNHVGHLDRDTDGLPVSFVVRLLAERSNNIDQAVSLLNQINHASGMNYGLIDKGKVRTFEVSANDVVEYLPEPALKRIWHTNHPLVNDNYCRNIDRWNNGRDISNSQGRFDFLARETRLTDKPLDVARVQELLSSTEAPVSVHEDGDFPTINAVVMSFDDPPALYFSPGPPSQNDFFRFTLD